MKYFWQSGCSDLAWNIWTNCACSTNWSIFFGKSEVSSFSVKNNQENMLQWFQCVCFAPLTKRLFNCRQIHC